MYQVCYPLGPAFASYQLLYCMLQTDLSAELALRSQYQCCFHKITKSAYYSMSLYIKSVQSNLLGNLLEISTIHIAQGIESTSLQI